MKGSITLTPTHDPDEVTVFMEINSDGDSVILGHVKRYAGGWQSMENVQPHNLRRDAIKFLQDRREQRTL